MNTSTDTTQAARTVHIIVAAGSGSRFGCGIPKQFRSLAGRPMLMRTIETFSRADPGAEIVLALSPDHTEIWAELCGRYGFDSPAVVAGGATRWQSVKNAVDARCGGAEVITVHDGARPLVSEELIRRMTEAVKGGCRAAVPAVAVTDSLRLVEADGSSKAVDRAAYRAVQTPQAFDGETLREAYSLEESVLFTDDASVVEAIGIGITLVDGDPANIKVTHPGDMAVAEAIIGAGR